MSWCWYQCVLAPVHSMVCVSLPPHGIGQEEVLVVWIGSCTQHGICVSLPPHGMSRGSVGGVD